MTVSNDASKYKKRAVLGLKTQAKAAASTPTDTHRVAVVRALVAAGPRAHLDLRTLVKKEPRHLRRGGNIKD